MFLLKILIDSCLIKRNMSIGNTFCMHCLQCFSSEEVLNNHKDNCIQVNGTQAVKMPEKNKNILKFNNFQ